MMNIELPAFYNDLALSLETAWSLLEQGARDRHAAFHALSVASVDQAGHPRQRTMILRLPPGFSSVINGEGATYAAHTRLLETHGDDGRGGEVSEVEVPLHATRLVAR